MKVLSAYNPWWKTGVVNPKMTKTYKRFAFYEAMKRIDQTDIRRTVVLTGTRRVGKTTIQYQMIEALLARGVPPQKIVFISMDHPMLKLSDFNDVLECYHENVYAEQDVFYFFDEIQYAQDWDKWLKTIYDLQPDTQIVATGSASPALVKGNRESGAGRWSVIQVPTMSFYEYCELLNLDRPNLPKNLKVTPHLLAKDGQTCIQLILDIKDESFSAVPEKSAEKAGTTTSSIATQALVYEGQSILVGGYFSEGYADGDSGVPVLKDVPILGHLFKSSSKKKEISERLFLITPKIIRLSASDPYGGLFKTPSNLTDSRELMQIQCRQAGESTDAARSNSKYFEDPLDSSPADSTPAKGSKSDNNSSQTAQKMSRTARLFAKQRKKAKQDDLENLHDPL